MRKLLYSHGDPLLSKDEKRTSPHWEEDDTDLPLANAVPYGSSSCDTLEDKAYNGETWGRPILFALAVVYGSLNVSMRLVFARPNPPTASLSSTIQGWFAVLCFLPLFVWRKPPRKRTNAQPSKPPLWKFAFELALWNFGTQGLINTSLVWTQGARASFLVQTSVVWTPVISFWVVGKNERGKVVWWACALALAGLWVLSVDSDNESNTDAQETTALSSWGDACCLMAALCWSLYICRLSAWGDFYDETQTQFVKNIILAVFYTIWMLVSLYTDSSVLWEAWNTDPIAWGILFYTALGPCTIADVFQQKAQASVPAAETNVILSLEPVFTTLLGFGILGERPSSYELAGGGLILIASFLVAGCGTPPPKPTLPLPSGVV